jgi:hypothetical protein
MLSRCKEKASKRKQDDIEEKIKWLTKSEKDTYARNVVWNSL